MSVLIEEVLGAPATFSHLKTTGAFTCPPTSQGGVHGSRRANYFVVNDERRRKVMTKHCAAMTTAATKKQVTLGPLCSPHGVVRRGALGQKPDLPFQSPPLSPSGWQTRPDGHLSCFGPSIGASCFRCGTPFGGGLAERQGPSWVPPGDHGTVCLPLSSAGRSVHISCGRSFQHGRGGRVHRGDCLQLLGRARVRQRCEPCVSPVPLPHGPGGVWCDARFLPTWL